MPILGGDETETEYAPRISAGELSVSDHQAAAERVGKSYSAGTIIGGSVAFAPLDLVDTAVSSLSMGHVERGSINRAALQMVDLPGLNDFYAENQGAIEIASGVTGIIASDLAARRLMAPASAFMKAASKLPYIRRVAALDTQYANALAQVRQVDKTLAARGALGVEQYVGRVTLDTGVDITRNRAWGTAARLGFAKGARNAAATEAVMGVTMNQNGFLYDESAAHNLMWMGLGVGIGGAVDWLHTAYSIRKAVNSDEIRRTFAGALDPNEVEESRLIWHGKKVGEEAQPASFFGGVFTDRATSYLMSATNLVESPCAAFCRIGRALPPSIANSRGRKRRSSRPRASARTGSRASAWTRAASATTST
jgi:hypothetical protein